MRYVGPISLRYALLASTLALAVAAIPHLGQITQFVGRESLLFSQMRQEQCAAQMAAFRLLIGENEKSVELDAR